MTRDPTLRKEHFDSRAGSSDQGREPATNNAASKPCPAGWVLLCEESSFRGDTNSVDDSGPG